MADDVRVGRLHIPEAELEWRFDTPGGPGGQHANRAATRAEVRWDVEASPSVEEEDRTRLLAKLGPVVTAAASDSRSQTRNRELALERLRTLVGEALRRERPRRPTKPSRAAKERRIDAKRQRGELKRSRGRIRPED
ncbi:MAG TPA: alternative ribosome rescue aminoacyl-tRNA hydrolase ArfB [Acidimicrobiales bacterium]|nr:alternative ribosome rescue aminoacyl-tRNA hydrolase ArfB [Acidimicrobiales bacterium]